MRLGLTKNRLRGGLTAFLLLLSVLTAIIVYQALSQMKWEAFRQHQILAEELADRIDSRLSQLIEREEQRSFAEYAFLNVVGDEEANFIQRSPLSNYPVEADIPGVVGYFQVDETGRFSTPLLPGDRSTTSYGISQNELELRQGVQQQIKQILSSHHRVKPSKKGLALNEAEASFSADSREVDTTTQGLFDQLESTAPAERRKTASKLGRVAELKLESQFEAQQAEVSLSKALAPVASKQKRVARKEQTALPESLPVASDEGVRLTTFESEIDPFHFSLLDSGHFVLFRNVWRNGMRHTQGILFQQDLFLNGVIEVLFRETALSEMSDLLVAFQGDVLSLFSGGRGDRYERSAELGGELLYQRHLSAPLDEIELIFSIKHLPAGPGVSVLFWATTLLVVVLLSGLYLIYRLGLKQLLLAQQQQDFVSAVSHELKTPLTSIRMYGEILREGWADEEKKQTYYDYIFYESERLTRLINNVLQLARMRRNDVQLGLKEVTLGELIDTLRSTLSSLVERNSFTLNIRCNEACEGSLQVDPDAFTQIFLNLVDNAIKFSAKAEKKIIDIDCYSLDDGSVEFSVRDYGPGIKKDQMKKVFQLFYRAENELTRRTTGTGIGLALVKQLAQQIGAEVKVMNHSPGVEFKLVFRQ